MRVVHDDQAFRSCAREPVPAFGGGPQKDQRTALRQGAAGRIQPAERVARERDIGVSFGPEDHISVGGEKRVIVERPSFAAAECAGERIDQMDRRPRHGNN